MVSNIRNSKDYMVNKEYRRHKRTTVRPEKEPKV